MVTVSQLHTLTFQELFIHFLAERNVSRAQLLARYPPWVQEQLILLLRIGCIPSSLPPIVLQDVFDFLKIPWRFWRSSVKNTAHFTRIFPYRFYTIPQLLRCRMEERDIRSVMHLQALLFRTAEELDTLTTAFFEISCIHRRNFYVYPPRNTLRDCLQYTLEIEDREWEEATRYTRTQYLASVPLLDGYL